MDDQELFKQTLAATGELFGKEITPVAARMYWRALAEYSDEQIQGAFNTALKTLKFMPKPSEIIELIDGTGNVVALESWKLVMDEIRKIGSYGQPRVSEEIKNVIHQLGGWEYLCSLDYKSLEFKARAFCEIYGGKLERGAIEHKPEMERLK